MQACGGCCNCSALISALIPKDDNDRHGSTLTVEATDLCRCTFAVQTDEKDTRRMWQGNQHQGRSTEGDNQEDEAGRGAKGKAGRRRLEASCCFPEQEEEQ